MILLLYRARAFRTPECIVCVCPRPPGGRRDGCVRHSCGQCLTAFVTPDPCPLHLSRWADTAVAIWILLILACGIHGLLWQAALIQYWLKSAGYGQQVSAEVTNKNATEPQEDSRNFHPPPSRPTNWRLLLIPLNRDPERAGVAVESAVWGSDSTHPRYVVEVFAALCYQGVVELMRASTLHDEVPLLILGGLLAGFPLKAVLVDHAIDTNLSRFSRPRTIWRMGTTTPKTTTTKPRG